MQRIKTVLFLASALVILAGAGALLAEAARLYRSRARSDHVTAASACSQRVAEGLFSMKRPPETVDSGGYSSLPERGDWITACAKDSGIASTSKKEVVSGFGMVAGRGS